MSREDDPFDGLLEQLGGALDRLDIADPATRDAIGSGVKKALSGLFGEPATEDEPPEVVVLDGGRTDDAPSAGERPDLEVVSAEPAEASESKVQVSVVGLSTSLGADGRWQVSGERQVVYSGPTARHYRVGCSRGEVQLLANGLDVATLLPGRTVDVEATEVVVDGSGAGAYRPL